MPIRRLNYTERQRIAQSDIDVILRSTESGKTFFDVRLSIAAYQFPSDSRVFVEAYRQTTLMRFDLGTVSVPALPGDRSLADFDNPAEVLFRVKVTAASGDAGKLLGEADQIRPREAEEQPDRRLPLLPPVPEDLDEEVWRVDFEGGTWLHVSKHLPDWKQTVRSHLFRALVYPTAMRQILERILYRENVTAADDPGSWQSRWIGFASSLPGSGPVPRARDEFDLWIEAAVAAFARQFKLRSRYTQDPAE